MALTFDTLPALLSHGFDDVIDVRSPAEYAEDHVPGAINLPVLSNEERAEVGTIYKQESPFLARKIGAAMVFRNAAAHIAGPLADRDGVWRPLVYCWRGGQRSGSFSWMLGQIGWRTDTIAGGYQTFRRLVHRALYTDPVAAPVVLLDGNTGTAKTELLAVLERRGLQVLDLEGLARHRGSLLGERPGGQPTQKAFETALATRLVALDPSRPVIVEAESSKIGERIIPPSLWAAMRAAPRIAVEAPFEARIRYLVEAYDDILSDDERLRARLAPLVHVRGRALVDHWFELIAAGDRHGLVASLMADHYDPAYGKSRRAPDRTVTAEGLDAPHLEAVAARIEQAVLELAAAR